MDLLKLKTKMIAKNVLKSSISRWDISSNTHPIIEVCDFENATGLNQADPNFSKVVRVVGQFLHDKNYISGQFTMVWSIYGFHVNPSAFDWLNETIYEKHKDVFNIIIGALLAIVTTTVTDLFKSNDVVLSEKILEPLRKEMKIELTNLSSTQGARLEKSINENLLKRIESDPFQNQIINKIDSELSGKIESVDTKFSQKIMVIEKKLHSH